MTLIDPFTLTQLKNMDSRFHSVDHSIRLIQLEYMEKRKREYEESIYKDVPIQDNNVYINIDQEEQEEYDEEDYEEEENRNFITCIFYMIFKLLVSKND